MENENLTTLQQEITDNLIKTIAKKVLNDLLDEMPTSNRWQWFYAFEEVARKYDVDIKEN